MTKKPLFQDQHTLNEPAKTDHNPSHVCHGFYCSSLSVYNPFPKKKRDKNSKKNIKLK